jgi:hypothetical protein
MNCGLIGKVHFNGLESQWFKVFNLFQQVSSISPQFIAGRVWQ